MILVKPHDDGAPVGSDPAAVAAAGPTAGRDRVLVPRRRDRSPKPRAFPDQGRKYTAGFENAFAARGDPTSPRLREHYLLGMRLCRTGSAPCLSGILDRLC